MDTAQLQFVAGSISSLLFATSVFPMLMKVFKTHDMRSYSFSNIVITNVANAVHWLYIVSLPPGPIWLLHAFYTVAALLLLLTYMCFARSSCVVVHLPGRPR